MFNESCFEYLSRLENESVDLVLIDPPYQISKKTNFLTGGIDRFAVSMEFGEWDNSFTGLETVIEECYRLLKKGGTLICFYDLWKVSELKGIMENCNLKQIRFIEWLKTNPVPLNSKINYLTNAREIALTCVKGGKPIFKSEYDNGIYNYPIYHDIGRFHPTQKPVRLVEDLINKHSNENDLVLDCFSGSGTTAIACMNTKRNFKGCELDKIYYDKSILRLKKNNSEIVIYEGELCER